MEAQQNAADDRARDRPDGADEEDGKQAARLAPNPADIRLEQEQRNSERHNVSPDNVVIEDGMCGDNARVDECEGNEESDDGP